MNWGKAIGLLILMVLTSPIGGFIWIPILFFGWKYVKFCIKIDLIVIYLIVRLPLWLFIQLPLYSLKVSTQKIDHFFSRGFNSFNRRRKLSVFLLIVFGAFFLFLFPTNLQEFNILSAYFWWNNLWAYIQILVSTIATVLIILSIIETYSGGVAQGEMPGEWARSELFAAPGEAVGQSVESAQRAVGGVREAQNKAKQAKGVYDDIRSAELDKGSLRSAVPGDMKKVLADLAESMGLDAAAAEGGTAAGAAATPLGWLAIAVFLLALLLFIVQLGLVLFFFWSYLQFIAPVVLGPLTAALGLGSDYGNYLGGEVADRFLVGINVDTGQYIDPVLEARQRVYCLLEGPACLREWRLNNTRNPGSESVGQEYLLDINRFEVGSGDQLDIRYKNGGYPVPISFGLYNTRHGLKGINAYNVSYRIRMIDFSRGKQDPYCATGWRPIEGYNIREAVAGSSYSGNDLYPGTSANTGFQTIENFNLENCGLLQPGAGETRTVTLEVKYDYYSQATLYFDAMARETLLSSPDITKEWRESETADTPVKSALNVNSPVIYNQDQLGTGDASQPFSMRASLYTEENDVQYRIKDLKVIKSSEVEISEQTPNSQCSFTNVGENVLRLQGEDASNTVLSADYLGTGGEVSNEGQKLPEVWYDSNSNPPFFGCTMELSDPGSISPGGETLTMGVESNYTVRLSEQLEQFRVLNSRCSTFNCPLLVTEQFATDTDNEDNWKTVCDGPDAGRGRGTSGGCSVVKGEPSDWATIEFLTADPREPNGDHLDARLERNEIAIDPASYAPIVLDNGDYPNMGQNEYAIGLTPSERERIEDNFYAVSGLGGGGSRGFALVSRFEEGERDVEIVELEYVLCEEQDSPIQDYRDYIRGETRMDFISFQPVFTACEQKGFWDGYMNEQKVRSSALLGPNINLIENQFRGLISGYKNIWSQFRDLTCEGEDSFKVYDPSEGPRCVGGEAVYGSGSG